MSTRLTPTISHLTKRAVHRVTAALSGPRDRGDVPGWVLITIMTAGLVTLLWGVAGDQLESLFTNAISSVSGPSGG